MTAARALAMRNGKIILGMQVLAFWSVWRWYAHRVMNSPDDQWGLLALVTVFLLLLFSKPPVARPNYSLRLPTLMVLLYAATYTILPPLLRAMLAVTAIAVTISKYRYGTSLHLGLWGLLLLSLPIIPSLQFYLGYPLRVLVTEMVAPFLQLNGFSVIREGTCLNWGGKLISIDAPCSGIRMLWTGLYLTFTLASCYRITNKQTILLVGRSLFVIIAANVLRATSLFYLESGAIRLPAWSHTGVGVVTFVVAAVVIVWSFERCKMREENACVPSCSI